MSDHAPRLIPSDRIILPQPDHVCIAVRDVEKTAGLYASLLGVGPFTVRIMHTPAARARVHGQPADYTLKFAYARTGPLVLELVETLAGPTIYQEHLARHGEGLHHVGYKRPAPLDEELALWEKQGFRALQVNYRDDPRYGWAYFDTQERLGMLIEVICDPPLGWWESLALAQDLKGPLGKA